MSFNHLDENKDKVNISNFLKSCLQGKEVFKCSEEKLGVIT